MSSWTSPSLPTGTITFLFTDVEGSTRLWEMHPASMRQVMARHDALLTAVFEQHDGIVVRPRGEGDSLFAVFVRATDAVAAALAGQRALAAAEWGGIGQLRVRMGLHTGEADVREGDYYGAAVNRCARIRAAGHGGQILLSQTIADLVRTPLPAGVTLLDLGRLRLKDLSEAEHLYQLHAPDQPTAFPPLKTLDTRPNNLPILLSSFIGREHDVAEVERLLNEARLLTLTGPGGSGKTRLALQVAAEALDAFPDGVFFVDLAPLGDPEHVPAAIARVLGLRESPEQSLTETLRFFLRDKSLLLVLDNVEHLTPAAPFVATLLAACPGLCVLATSREPLHLTGERQYPVLPLSLPEDHAAHLVAVASSPAVALFVARTRDVRPDFALTRENAPAVAAICARLDGLPLAIELAAAWTKALPPAALLARMEQRLPLLTGGPRDAPARQQTLRDTIAWSYALLTAAEQALFRRLAVFVGGCTLEAAEAVCTAKGDLGVTVLDGLAALVDQSLLREEGTGAEPRFGMLETIREFALEQLDLSGEAESVRRWRTAHFVDLVRTAGRRVYTAGRAPWDQRLSAEQDNLRSVLRWCLDSGDTEAGLRIVGGLWLWFYRAAPAEGLYWANAVIAGDVTGNRTAIRARALLGQAVLAWARSDYASMYTALQESVAIWRELGNKAGLAEALSWMPFCARADPVLTRALGEESVQLYRELNNPGGLGYALHTLAAHCIEWGDYATARALAEESVTIFRELGDRWLIGFPLSDLAQLALIEGDYEAARLAYEERLPALRAAGDQRNLCGALMTLAHIAHVQGRSGTANIALYKEAIPLAVAVEDEEAIASSLQQVVFAFAGSDESARWVRILAAARTVLETVTAPRRWRGRGRGVSRGVRTVLETVVTPRGPDTWALMKPADKELEMHDGRRPVYRGVGSPRAAERLRGRMEEYTRSRNRLREALGEERFERAWSEGVGLTLEQAAAEALAALASVAAQPVSLSDLPLAAKSEAPTAARLSDDLSPREADVLRVLAAGKSNKEIAAALVLSVRTVETHVAHIYAKTGATNRVEAAAYAQGHGLIAPSAP